ncbi:MAG: hypothetical protein RDU01_02170 [Thermodesulfovibrionales bacterium]|nr:hypothetical protein [Thermodesulfovibrionales bacterium]
MKRRMYACMLAFYLAGNFFAMPFCSAIEEDLCAKDGIAIKNLTLRSDLWYSRNKGDCTLLSRHQVTRIKPEETLEIFSDLVCRTPYCANSPTYSYYKSLDKDGDCTIRILPEANLTDM